jgi:RNA polymerase sigma factor (sigma-70 family)
MREPRPGSVTRPRPRTEPELKLLRVGDPAVVEEMLLDWDETITSMAKRRTRCPASQDDLAQVGRLALVKASKHFDPARTIPFNHYAARAIRNETAKAHERSRPVSYGDSALATIPAPTSEMAGYLADVREWVCRQPRPMQKLYVALYCRGMSQREAAARLHVSQAWISIQHKQLLERARREFAFLSAA